MFKVEDFQFLQSIKSLTNYIVDGIVIVLNFTISDEDLNNSLLILLYLKYKLFFCCRSLLSGLNCLVNGFPCNSGLGRC